MAYLNPGYAATQALDSFLLDRETRARQKMLDDLKLQQAQLELEDHQRRVEQETQDRARTQFEKKTAQLVPGDVVDADLLAEGQRVGMPLPTKIQADGSDEQGPMPNGADPLGTQRVYPGSPQYRMGQMKIEQDRALAATKAQALAAIDPKNPATLEAAMQAGASPAEIKSVIESTHYTDPNAPVPIVRIGRDGKLETLGEAPKNAHFQNEPAPVNVSVGQGGMDSLSDSALSFMAERVLAGGDEPAFGSGTQGAIARQKFATKLAEMAAAQGIPGEELARRRMRYKAEQASASNLQKNFDATEAFSAKGKLNLANLEESMKEIPDSNMSFVNALTRGVARYTGDTNVANFDTYRRSVATEFARIISSINGGVLTDSARKEVDELVRPNASVAQIKSSLDALKKEVENRHTTFSAQLEGLYTPRGQTPVTATMPAPGGSVSGATTETPDQRKERLRKAYLGGSKP